MTTRRTPIAIAMLALFGVTGLAIAAGWQDFAPAFPGQPCSDGWAGCIVGDTVVTPGMVLDGAQRMSLKRLQNVPPIFRCSF